MTQAMILTVAPNGAYKQKQDHRALPVTPSEVVEAAREAVLAGATMIHTHARDEQGRHSLDPRLNQQIRDMLKTEVGDDIAVQLTTEAAGIYQPPAQMAMVREVQPEAVSVAVRELLPEDKDTHGAQGFFHWLATQEIVCQYILYSAEDVQRYHRLKAAGVIPSVPHHLLFVLGRYHAQQQSSPDDLLPFLAAHRDDTPWMVCAFGADEHRCARLAMQKGGDVRVGFENNLYDQHGELAADNSVLIRQVAAEADAQNRRIMTAAQWREQFAF
ncbi:3-keto-5-aminohexanoate cleavage protein [Aliamphritea hakodatensis]|uniref:3-keto-5-aminohexanoate cleavage protein n=1 Tax=Aliamphritea hakodatensis TaxID=2895352 RepID=UPI0022FD737E|nr:3-keto-5-aminohexanoate cleavage protein [Aliamphritea hakodatensis]